MREAADKLHDELTAPASTCCSTIATSVPASMFADMELIGIPHRVVVGERGLKEGQVEYQGRRDAQPQPIALAEAVAFVKSTMRT